jgi:hypothetical protein
MKLYCNRCIKPVSTEVPEGTVVKAWLECEECSESPNPEPRMILIQNFTEEDFLKLK